VYVNTLSSYNLLIYFLVQMIKGLLFTKNRSSCRIHTAFKHNNVASTKLHNVNAILTHRLDCNALDIKDVRCWDGWRFLILRSVVPWDYQHPSTHTVSSCFLCCHLRNYDDDNAAAINCEQLAVSTPCQCCSYTWTIIRPYLECYLYHTYN
jgi:hypothetical protein